MQVDEEKILAWKHDKTIGEVEWIDAGIMVDDLRRLDQDTKRCIGGVKSVMALKGREWKIKETHGMEHAERIADLGDLWSQ
jgi:hypothetical protein